MIAPVFVDANVLVYLRDATNAVKQSRAAEWMDRLWRERSGRTSMQVLSEFYVTATRRLRPVISNQIAWSFVDSLLAWQPQPIDAMLLRRAREIEMRHRLSWWDSMVVAAAQLQDCAVLLTEDLQDGATFGNVTVRSPFTLAVEESRGKYEVPSIALRHPARGRPRKRRASLSASAAGR